jgi:hypothetical protein
MIDTTPGLNPLSPTPEFRGLPPHNDLKDVLDFLQETAQETSLTQRVSEGNSSPDVQMSAPITPDVQPVSMPMAEKAASKEKFITTEMQTMLDRISLSPEEWAAVNEAVHRPNEVTKSPLLRVADFYVKMASVLAERNGDGDLHDAQVLLQEAERLHTESVARNSISAVAGNGPVPPMPEGFQS